MKRKIKSSNYIELAIIFIFVILAVLGFRNLYLSRQTNDLNTPIIRDVISKELMSNEIENYLKENEDALIYIGISSDINSRNVEKRLKKYIKNNDLKDTIVYLNLTSEKNIKVFFETFNNHYEYKENINEYPSFIYFKDSKIKDVLSGDITLNQFKEFLNINNIK